jgi:hypothetical protein
MTKAFAEKINKNYLITTAKGKKTINRNPSLLIALMENDPSKLNPVKFDYQRPHIFKITINGISICLKEMEKQKPENLKKQFFKLLDLKEAGIRTPTPFFYLKTRKNEFLAMEWVKGMNLERLAASSRRHLPLSLKKKIVSTCRRTLKSWVKKGLQYRKVHGRTSLHGSNLIVCLNPRIRLFLIDPITVSIKKKMTLKEKKRQFVLIENMLQKNNLIFVFDVGDKEDFIQLQFNEVDNLLKNEAISQWKKKIIIHRLKKQGYFNN